MMIRCCFICVLSVLITKVSLQLTVEGFIGGSVVLPCSSAEHDLTLQDISVHWRHKDSKIVYDIVKGEDSIETQDMRYKNRTKTFPEEYVRRNFSIRLTDLTHADAGKYICLITPSSEQETVELIINESTAETGNRFTNQRNRGEDTVTSPSLLCVYIVVAVWLNFYYDLIVAPIMHLFKSSKLGLL